MTKLTDEQRATYVQNGGVYCPFCESTDIGAVGQIQADVAMAWQNVTCNWCGEEWQDVYKLVNVEGV